MNRDIFPPLQLRKPSCLPYILIAGPCSAETEEQTFETARALSQMGVCLFRASLWKPRTRPGGFEGVGEEGIPWLKRVRDELGMQVATEVATAEHISLMLASGFDTFWIGARTTSSPFAMTEIAQALEGKEVTVMVKNPINPDIELWEGALLRLWRAGLRNIAAIHRGFSLYERGQYRNPPLWQIPLELKRRHPQLTLIADPSHITGAREQVASMCQMALEMNYDGLIIETHPTPEKALSDAAQQITPKELGELISHLKPLQSSDTDSLPLKYWRAEIDLIDEQILGLLGKRMQLSREIGAFKRERDLCIVQPNRFRALLQRRLEIGKGLGLSEELVLKLFSQIHEESVHLQHHLGHDKA